MIVQAVIRSYYIFHYQNERVGTSNLVFNENHYCNVNSDYINIYIIIQVELLVFFLVDLPFFIDVLPFSGFLFTVVVCSFDGVLPFISFECFPFVRVRESEVIGNSSAFSPASPLH